jgi:molecular chaperone DnaK
MIFTAEKLLRDFAERLPEDAKKQTQEKIEAVRSAQGSGDINDIRVATDTLSAHVQSLGGSMYQNAGTDGVGADGAEAGAGDADAKPSGEDVIDAEFTEA